MALCLSQNLREVRSDEAILLYNSKNGNNLVICEGAIELYNMLKFGQSIEEIKEEVEGENLDEFFESLINKKFLITPDEVEKVPSIVVPDDSYIQAGKMLQHLRLNVTEACNLNCSYCYERVSNVWNKHRVMGWEIAKKAIDNFFDNVKKNENKNVSVRFFGGEPLLNWTVVEKSVNYIKTVVADDICVNYIINTNGTLVTDEIAKFLSDNKISISLSVDGTKEAHDAFRVYPDGRGSFETIDKNMKFLIEHKCIFNLSVVCTESTLPTLTSLIDYVHDKQNKFNYRIPLCFNFIQITKEENKLSVDEKVGLLIKALDYANEKEVWGYGGLTHFVFEKLLHNYIGTYCGGTGSEFSIDPLGDVFPCSGLDIKLGNISDFNNIFKSDTYRTLCKRKSGNIEQCNDCELECFCSGGCTADVGCFCGRSGDSENESPNERVLKELPKGNTRYCDLQKKVFVELVKHYLL